MVSTRNHPDNFPPPSPSKVLARSSPSPKKAWAHTPSNFTLTWLAVSLPLVAWDTGYVLLRPYSMTGGSLHSPIFEPYALYATVDYVYGVPAYNAANGFTSAQGTMNLVESIFYGYYLWIVYAYSRSSNEEGRGAPKPGIAGWLGEAKVVENGMGGLATLIGFTAAVMTVSKTVLYWLKEYYSGFDNIGHNDISSLILLWIIPNGAWLVFPSYMIYVFGQEILQGLAIASGSLSTESNATVEKDD
ncbi:MAG: hypothetical protein M1827_006254 [Pycnora praestabilis]|nr:MAG: hypothetical protein M1827_006254 [Pycnora praestabilis]